MSSVNPTEDFLSFGEPRAASIVSARESSETAELDPQVGAPARRSGGSNQGKERSAECELREQNDSDTLPSQLALPAGRLASSDRRSSEEKGLNQRKAKEDFAVTRTNENSAFDALFDRLTLFPQSYLQGLEEMLFFVRVLPRQGETEPLVCIEIEDRRHRSEKKARRTPLT